MAFSKDLLSADEEIVLDLRPHWWFLVPAGAILVVSLLIAGAIAFFLGGGIGYIIAAVVLLPALANFVMTYMKWTTTNFVITNERIISREGVAAKRGIEIPLDRVNTVFFNQTVFERMIGAGDLAIESAGEGGRQNFSDVRRPNVVQSEIYRVIEGFEDNRLERLARAATSGVAAAPSIPEQIEQLDGLRQQGVLTEQEFQAKKKELLDRM
ncbi:MAG: PH domain-containing protein [Acidimicrobiales bacterium]